MPRPGDEKQELRGDLYMKYDEYELLEMFESEPIFLATKEAGLYRYSYIGKNNVKIVLYISVYENECDISLYLHENPLFKAELTDVEFIRQDENRLRIHQNNADKDYIIYFKPTICIVIE